MVIVNFQGRLANNIFQFIAGLFFSKKHNLPLYLNHQGCFVTNNNYSHEIDTVICKYQTSFHIDYKNETFIIDDSNFFENFEKTNLPKKNYSFVGYYQTKKFLSPIKDEIKEILNITYDNNVNEDEVFIHYRLGDIENSQLALPLEYYIDALSLLGNPSGYISSDSIENKNCQFLIKNYNLKPIKLTPWGTILFAKNFKKIILSEGSFSALIGLLSDQSQVVCNIRDLKWCGDISDGFDNYITLSWGYSNYPIAINYKK